MKKKKLTLAKGICICFLALVLGALALNSWARNKQDGKDSVLVTVNDVKITKGEVDKKIQAMLGPRAKTLPPETLAEIRDRLNGKVLDSMIVETLLTEAIEKQNTTVKDEEVEEALKQLQDSFSSGASFEQYLRNMGLSQEDLRQSMSKNLRIKKLLEQQTTDPVPPTEKETDVYYIENSERFQMPESVNVRHILVAVKPDDKEAAKSEKRKKVEKI